MSNLPQARPFESGSWVSEVVGRGGTLGQSWGPREEDAPAQRVDPSRSPDVRVHPRQPRSPSAAETSGHRARGFGAEGRRARTFRASGARTMTGQEVPRDGLPAPQVARPASLGISEVLSSRWVSNIAPDQG